MIDLIPLFRDLESPQGQIRDGIRFAACSIPDYETCRLAKDQDGDPAVLIKAVEIPSGSLLAPIRLEYLSILYGATCQVTRTNGILERDVFTVIRCVGGDDELTSYFLRIMSLILAAVGESPNQQDVNRTLITLIELFRALTAPPRKSLQGLWGEVFLIFRARRPKVLVDAWHVQPESLYDFALDGEQIEVKTSGKKMRLHHFSLEQLCPQSNTTLFIASLFVEKSSTGISLVDLADRTSLGLKDPYRLLKFERLIAQTLGNSWRLAAEERFDPTLAENSLAFYSVSEIPCISRAIPPKVRSVHFESDLSGSHPTDIRAYASPRALFAAL